MNTVSNTKIRKNFVFSEETNNQLEKLKAVNHQSATKIVQELIAKSYEYIAKQEQKQALVDFANIDNNCPDGKEFANKNIKELKVLMYEEKYGV